MLVKLNISSWKIPHFPVYKGRKMIKHVANKSKRNFDTLPLDKTNWKKYDDDIFVLENLEISAYLIDRPYFEVCATGEDQ